MNRLSPSYSSKIRATLFAAALLPLGFCDSAQAQLTITFNPFAQTALVGGNPVDFTGTITNTQTTGAPLQLADFKFDAGFNPGFFVPGFDASVPFQLAPLASYTGGIFTLTNDSAPNGVYNDTFTVLNDASAPIGTGAFQVSVPEPASLSLLGIGLAAFALRGRRGSRLAV